MCSLKKFSLGNLVFREFSNTMAISNELSSEIAAAILVDKKSPQELRQLRDVILQVHSALQKMSEEARANRFKTLPISGKSSPDRHN